MMNWKKPKTFAVQHRNENIRAASRSGGIFTALSDYTLEQGGIVYGCVLTEIFEAVHVRAESKQERDRMRGSKYIQSRMNDTYKNVKSDLEAGRRVLFSGTSCQVDGLKKYLGREYEDLFFVDIVCHGVPSPKVWKTYLAWQGEKKRSEVRAADFRNKKNFGWRDHVETLCLGNGRVVHSKIFTTLFYEHSILRPCCYKCPYKAVMHPGDITIADYWGIEKAAPEFDDNKGVSLVLVNNEKGEEIFNIIKTQIKWKETKLEDSIQPPLRAPFPEPQNRKNFWIDFKNRDFAYIARKYGGMGMRDQVMRISRKVKRRMIGP